MEERPHAKKLVPVFMLEILRKHSDADHPLTQKQILEYLRDDHGIELERKAIRRNIGQLQDAEYPIECPDVTRSIVHRNTGEPDETDVRSNFYYEHEFDESELRLLIDSVQFFKYISQKQRTDLVKKLEGLSSKYFKSRAGNLAANPDSSPYNGQMFLTIDVLDEAISNKRQISFKYGTYGIDKKLRPKTGEDGKALVYTVNPYQMAALNGRYYLISNTDGHDNVSPYRIDRILDIKILDTPARNQRELPELKGKGELDLPRHMAEHIYMFPGPSEPVTFRMKKYILNDVIDWFGKDVTFTSETDDEVTATVRVNLRAMRLWAMQYAKHVTVLSPQSLADEVREDIAAAAKGYGLGIKGCKMAKK